MEIRPKNFAAVDRFLWTDMPEAQATLANRSLRSNPELLQHFIDDGYATRSNSVAQADLDFFMDRLKAAVATPESGLYATFWDEEGKKHLPARPEHLEKKEAKLLDIHSHLPASHRLIFSPRILDFLRDVFQDDPVAFQTLYFEYGSTQGAHNDTAFVYVDPPYQFVASWIALEDIEPETGELFYYPRSNKIGDQIFATGGKAFDPKDEHAASYSKTLDEMMAAHGLERHTFVPKQRDVLFWSADLVHGGSEIIRRRTRRSLVTHYCPLRATVPYARHLGKKPVHTQEGGWIVSAT